MIFKTIIKLKDKQESKLSLKRKESKLSLKRKLSKKNERGKKGEMVKKYSDFLWYRYKIKIIYETFILRLTLVYITSTVP